MSKTFKDIGEFEFIDRIRAGCLIRSDRIVKAIGDDAAAFEVPAAKVTLLTTDLLVERVHFIRQATSGFNLGYKALAVNLSDIAAMGGMALEAFISLGIPDSTEIDYIEDVYRGVQSLAAEFDVNILGGDTTRSKTDLIINIAIVGTVAPNEVLGRDKAQSGDRICITGYLGDSRAGLHLVLNPPEAEGDTWTYLKDAHFMPRPQIKEARFLAKYQSVHAAIDVSDGLSSDLAHILKASDKSAKLNADKIPVSKDLLRFCKDYDFDPVRYALAGGEDYVLICTIAPSDVEYISRKFEDKFARPLFIIGEITPSGPLELVDSQGDVEQLRLTGWDHFLKDLKT